jgi:Tol biopolymer transport system component
MRMRVWLVLLAALPLLTVGSGASTAGTSNPPQNGLIASRGADGIYLIDAQRAQAWKVPGTVQLGEPTWSPDGSLLAVEGWDDSGSNVYTIRPDGSDRRLVLKNAWSPSWSPDGNRLVVVHGDGAGSLATVRTDGSDLQSFTFASGNDSDVSEPVWSPDGKWIAFVGGQGAVDLVSPDGGEKGFRRIADSGWNLAWSPDGSKLAFETAEKAKDYRQEVVVLDLATGQRATLASRPNHPISAPAWSPDGKEFAFLSSRPMPKASTGGCGGEMPMDLWVMNADGSKPHRLSEGNYSQPSWGTFQPEPKPSSQQQPKSSSQQQPKPSSQPEPKPSAGPVAVSNATKAPAVSRVPTVATPLAGRDGLIAARGRDAIYLIDPDRGKVHKIPGTAKMAQPAWSPDGSLLAVSLADADGSSVYTIRPDGSHPQLVLSNASLPSWARDGKRLFVARGLCRAQGSCQAGDDDSTVFMSVRPDGSDARKVTFEDGDVYDGGETAWPTDGNWAAFFADEGANPTSLDSSTAAWSPDEKRLAFVSNAPAAEGGPGGETTSGLWIVAADGGKPQLLAAGISGRPSWGTPGPAKSPSG